MSEPLPEELIDAIYQTALEPAAWSEVMQCLKRSFPSAAQTFYFLHIEPHRVQPVCLAGIEPHWLRSFDALYFAQDNPWIRLTQRLHRPGVVRTNERLDCVLRDHGALYRSSYYNDWMRPQGFKYTIGNTLLSEGGIVANITLMRSPDMPTFDDDAVRRFEVVSKHMTRALQIASRLECPEASATSTGAFDAIPQPVAIVDAKCRLLYANAAMEGLLQGKRGLSLHQGILQSCDGSTQPRFLSYLAGALSRLQTETADAPLLLPAGRAGPLTLLAMPLGGSLRRSLPQRPTLLLLAAEHATTPTVSDGAIGLQYGCTPSEARLAQLLTEGQSLHMAAQAMHITYGTARTYLKVVFDKIGVRTQAQLVARVMLDLAR